jgi:hypothetical protein
MTPDLPRKFKALGFSFDRITTVKWADGKGNIYTEIDGLLENGNQAMAVEVKTSLRRNDIDERMERVRKYADEHGDRRDFQGPWIHDNGPEDQGIRPVDGVFVMEPSGEDVTITKSVSGPNVW